MRLSNWFGTLKSHLSRRRLRQPQHSARRQRTTQPACYCQQLEDRILLTNDLFVITHGFAFIGAGFPDWAYDMATAINDRLPADERVNGAAEIRSSKVNFDQPLSGGGNGPFLLLDWSDQSNNTSAYSGPFRSQMDSNSWAEAAGVFLFNTIVARLVAPETTEPLNLHFIGHSRGAVVNSEVIERLSTELNDQTRSKIGFVQMTTLDPHPVKSGEGLPPVILATFQYSDPPVTVANSFVDFADNYYQTLPGLLNLEGQVIVGSVNVNLNSQLQSWNGREGNTSGLNHAEVHDWYQWTIDLAGRNGTAFYRDPVLNVQRTFLDRDGRVFTVTSR